MNHYAVFGPCESNLGGHPLNIINNGAESILYGFGHLLWSIVIYREDTDGSLAFRAESGFT